MVAAPYEISLGRSLQSDVILIHNTSDRPKPDSCWPVSSIGNGPGTGRTECMASVIRWQTRLAWNPVGVVFGMNGAAPTAQKQVCRVRSFGTQDAQALQESARHSARTGPKETESRFNLYCFSGPFQPRISAQRPEGLLDGEPFGALPGRIEWWFANRCRPIRLAEHFERKEPVAHHRSA